MPIQIPDYSSDVFFYPWVGDNYANGWSLQGNKITCMRKVERLLALWLPHDKRTIKNDYINIENKDVIIWRI